MYVAGNFEAENSLIHDGHWSTFTGNSALLPSDIIDFAMLPTQGFWRETLSL